MNDLYSSVPGKGLKNIDYFLILTIILALYMPIIGVQLYFRHDDSQVLLWAKEYSGTLLSIFNPEPWVGEFNEYPGVGGTYRPFESLYIMVLFRIFGPNPFPFHLINGLGLIVLFIFLYKTAELFTDRRSAFLGALIFHLGFQSIMYGNFHVVVPFGFFFQMGCFYFTARGLVRNDKKSLLIALLFYIPATNRQTTPILLPVMILVYLLSHWKQSFPGSKFKYILMGVSWIPAIVIPFSTNASTATFVNRGFNFSQMFEFVMERLLFYGKMLTSGFAGFLVLICVFSFMIVRFLNYLKFNKDEDSRVGRWAFIWIPLLVSILVVVVMKISILAVIMLFSSLLFIVFSYKSLRFAGTWFFLSIMIFCAIDYFISSYLLEAVFGLSIILGYTLHSFLQTSWQRFRFKTVLVENKKAILITAIILVLLLGSASIALHKPSLLWEKLEAAQILIETNKNFSDLMTYVVHECPEKTRLYKLSIFDMDVGPRRWRFWSMEERAGRVGVMSVKEIRAMLKVLDRYDMKLIPSNGIIQERLDTNHFFIVLNKYEKEIAEERFHIEPIKRFVRSKTEAAIYRFVDE